MEAQAKAQITIADGVIKTVTATCTELVIPAEVTSIDPSALAECINLKTIKISNPATTTDILAGVILTAPEIIIIDNDDNPIMIHVGLNGKKTKLTSLPDTSTLRKLQVQYFTGVCEIVELSEPMSLEQLENKIFSMSEIFAGFKEFWEKFKTRKAQNEDTRLALTPLSAVNPQNPLLKMIAAINEVLVDQEAKLEKITHGGSLETYCREEKISTIAQMVAAIYKIIFNKHCKIYLDHCLKYARIQAEITLLLRALLQNLKSSKLATEEQYELTKRILLQNEVVPTTTLTRIRMPLTRFAQKCIERLKTKDTGEFEEDTSTIATMAHIYKYLAALCTMIDSLQALSALNSTQEKLQKNPDSRKFRENEQSTLQQLLRVNTVFRIISLSYQPHHPPTHLVNVQDHITYFSDKHTTSSNAPLTTTTSQISRVRALSVHSALSSPGGGGGSKDDNEYSPGMIFTFPNPTDLQSFGRNTTPLELYQYRIAKVTCPVPPCKSALEIDLYNLHRTKAFSTLLHRALLAAQTVLLLKNNFQVEADSATLSEFKREIGGVLLSKVDLGIFTCIAIALARLHINPLDITLTTQADPQVAPEVRRNSTFTNVVHKHWRQPLQTEDLTIPQCFVQQVELILLGMNYSNAQQISAAIAQLYKLSTIIQVAAFTNKQYTGLTFIQQITAVTEIYELLDSVNLEEDITIPPTLFTTASDRKQVQHLSLVTGLVAKLVLYLDHDEKLIVNKSLTLLTLITENNADVSLAFLQECGVTRLMRLVDKHEDKNYAWKFVNTILTTIQTTNEPDEPRHGFIGRSIINRLFTKLDPNTQQNCEFMHGKLKQYREVDKNDSYNSYLRWTLILATISTNRQILDGSDCAFNHRVLAWMRNLAIQQEIFSTEAIPKFCEQPQRTEKQFQDDITHTREILRQSAMFNRKGGSINGLLSRLSNPST